MTTWDPSNEGSNVALSGGDLVATATGSGGSAQSVVFTTTSKSSGKWAIRLTGDLRDGGVGGTYHQGGITKNLASYEANDTDSYRLFQQGGDEWDLQYNSSRIAFEYPTSSFPSMPDGTDELLILLNLDDNLLYFRLNGTYFLNSENYPNPPNPATPVGGIPISAGNYFIYRLLYTSGAAVTLDPSPTGLPSGYSAWDAGGGGSDTPINPPQGNVALSSTAPTVALTTSKARPIFRKQQRFFRKRA